MECFVFYVYNVGLSTFFALRNQNGYNFNPSPVHISSFYFHKQKCNNIFWGFVLRQIPNTFLASYPH